MPPPATDPGRQPWRAALVAAALAGVILGPLLIGFEPVGGDPDRIFRPIKRELAASLRRGTVPFWDDRLGLGTPLVAESHAAAFYPPNWAAYGLLGVNTAYRLSMWLHTVLIVVATFLYARRLGLTPWGSALAGVTLAFCGMQAIHSSHEWMYHTLAYMPLSLWLLEGYLASGRAAWAGGLILALGAQWTLGHFQVATYTNAMVLVLGVIRGAFLRVPLRGLATVAAVLGGLAVAAVQLGPSWELARFVGQTERSLADRMFYSFPPWHLIEPFLPWMFRPIPPEHGYWFAQQTTGYEACLYVGTLPNLLACVGVLGAPRGLRPWLLLAPASLALATMPRWWPAGYVAVLSLPGLGFFRCPARYTIIASLGLALLAGAGLDRTIAMRRFCAGIVLGIIGLVAACAVFASTIAAGLREVDFAPAMTATGLAWAVALTALIGWRGGRVAGWAIVALAALELGALYYRSTTRWGRPIRIPSESPLLTVLAGEPRPISVAGELDNIPLRAGIPTGTPYLGFQLHEPAATMRTVALAPRAWGDEQIVRWLRRLGVTHMILSGEPPRFLEGGPMPGSTVWSGADPALERATHRDGWRWALTALGPAGTEAWVATRMRLLQGVTNLRIEMIRRPSAEGEVLMNVGDLPPNVHVSARSARLLSWDGTRGEVERDGSCLLVLRRSYYPGWFASIDGGPAEPVLPVEGGLQAVAVRGAGRSHVEVKYRPTGWELYCILSLAGIGLGVGLMIGPALFRREHGRPADAGPGSPPPAAPT